MAEQKDLYEVLGVARGCGHADIKRAYHRLALQLHPDKNPGDDEASAKFQALQRIYGVLGDAEKRKLYDATGSLEDSELGSQGFDDLYAYFRGMFAAPTAESIDAFADRYRGSEEERRDLLDYYSKHKGNMAAVFDWVMLSEAEADSHRFMDAIQAAIDSGEVKRFKPFTAWAKGVAARPRPANPLQKRKASAAAGSKQARAKQQDDSGALVAAINSKRGSQLDGLVAALTAKYGGAGASGDGPAKGRKSKRQEAVEPSDEEFEAARARLAAKAGGGGGAKKGSPKKQRRG